MRNTNQSTDCSGGNISVKLSLYQTDSNRINRLVLTIKKMTRPDLNELKATDVLNVYCSGYNLVQSLYLLSKLKRKQFDFLQKRNGKPNCFNVQFQYSTEESSVLAAKRGLTTADSSNGRVLAKRRKATKGF